MCKQLVKESWDSTADGDIQKKIKTCAVYLGQWGKEIINKFNERLKLCKKEMRKWRKSRDDESVKKYKEAKDNLILILQQKEIFWMQRSKQMWLHSGTGIVDIFTLQRQLEKDQIKLLD